MTASATSFLSYIQYLLIRYILLPLRIAQPLNLHFAPEPAIVPVIDGETGKVKGEKNLRELVEGSGRERLFGRKAFYVPSFFVPG